MAKARKDDKGRNLQKGESQRSDGRYQYAYTDPLHKRHFIYDKELRSLREKEKKLLRNQLDGLDLYASGKCTVNEAYDRYISTKTDLKNTTRSNYDYNYNRYVKEKFGFKKLSEVKFSDVLLFYIYLVDVENLSLNTVDSVHCLLHPIFQLAVRDDIIRKNPTDGAMKELNKRANGGTGVRHALKPEEEDAFLGYVEEHPIYHHWWPILVILFRTGMRIGECLGLIWDDIDDDNIHINRNLVYYPDSKTRKSVMRINTPKTDAGRRTIPMCTKVKKALKMEREAQLATTGLNTSELCGVTGFIFQNRYGGIMNPQNVNRAIKRMTDDYNAQELLKAYRAGRDPVIVPKFSCHILRHTFATRLCEVESNMKVIQSVMGHKNIETTMNIYAEATDRGKQEALAKLSKKLDGLS